MRGSLIDPNANVLERFVPLGLPDFGDFLSDPAVFLAAPAALRVRGCVFLATPAASRVRGPLGLASEQSRLAPSAHALRLLGSET
ncbi:hypothetical protein ACLMAJ_30445, partial [Nocardia sp. KC 131]